MNTRSNVSEVPRDPICRCGHEQSRHYRYGCLYEHDHGAGIYCDCYGFKASDLK